LYCKWKFLNGWGSFVHKHVKCNKCISSIYFINKNVPHYIVPAGAIGIGYFGTEFASLSGGSYHFHVGMSGMLGTACALVGLLLSWLIYGSRRLSPQAFSFLAPIGRLARSGLVGLGFTNAPASIAPLGGKRPVVGTNPIALGVPGAEGEAAFVIDQSASVVAKSEIMMHARRGEAIPEGWALDREGQPTTDPDSALQGSMAPSGGYKGFGVGMIVEVFAAALSGATLGINASPFSGTAGGPPRTGQCFIAFAPGAFSGDAFAERIDALAGAISAQEGCRLPGERRRQARERIRSTGVEVSEDLLARIRAFMP